MRGRPVFPAVFPNRVKELEERAERWKGQADAMEPELAQIRETIANLDKREKELRERMLVP